MLKLIKTITIAAIGLAVWRLVYKEGLKETEKMLKEESKWAK